MGLERLVNLDGDFDYVGKAALADIATRGTSQRLVGLGFDGPPVGGFIRPLSLLSSDGVKAGHVTSLAWSPRCRRNIGFAIVPVELSDEGTPMLLETGDGKWTGDVMTLPFVPHRRTKRKLAAEAAPT